MRDLRIEKLSKNLLTHSISLKENDILYIDILGESAIPLGIELLEQARKIGAYVIYNITNYSLLRSFLLNSNEEQIKIYAKNELEKMKQATAYIGIRASDNASALSNIPNEKIELYNKYYIHPVHLEERVNNTNFRK